MKSRLQVINGNSREQEARRKFFSGLYAEYSGVAFKNNNYIEEHDLIEIINKAHGMVEDPEKEHLLYKLGVHVLAQKKENPMLEKIKSLFSNENDFQKYRFHNLVKIGAIIENNGLTKLNRAAMVGAFKYIYNQENEI